MCNFIEVILMTLDHSEGEFRVCGEVDPSYSGGTVKNLTRFYVLFIY